MVFGVLFAFLGGWFCGLFASLFDFWFVVWFVWGLWLNFVLVYFGDYLRFLVRGGLFVVV